MLEAQHESEMSKQARWIFCETHCLLSLTGLSLFSNALEKVSLDLKVVKEGAASQACLTVLRVEFSSQFGPTSKEVQILGAGQNSSSACKTGW